MPFDDSLKIQTATAMGKITLALRNSSDMNGQGNVAFGASDWDSHKQARQPDQKFITNGFASYTDHSGRQREFILGQDNKWFINSGDEG